MPANGPGQFPPFFDPITRAQFVRRAAGVGLAIPTVGTLLAACGSDDDDDGGGNGASGASLAEVASVGDATTTPAPSGDIDFFSWAVTAEPSSLDPALAYSDPNNQVICNFAESLVRVSPDYVFEPSLAESWENPDPTTWVFKIRQGVTFHDGSELTMDDVLFSLERHLDAATSFWAIWTTRWDSVEITGPDEITLNLTEPDSLIPDIFATSLGSVVKQSDVEGKGAKYGTPDGLPIGTGPFKLERWDSGQSVTLTRFDGYWDTEQVAKAETVEFQFILEPSALLNALVSGDVDGSYMSPANQLDQLESSGSGTLYQGRTIHSAWITAWDKEGSPLLDPRIRMAWLAAIDRVALAEQVWNGAAAPLRNTFVPLDVFRSLGEENYAKAEAAYFELPGPEPDLDRANALLDEAGGAPSEELVFWIGASSLDAAIGPLVQAAGQEIGLNIKLEKHSDEEVVGLYFDAAARSKVDAALNSDYMLDIPNPMDIIWQLASQPPDPGVTNYNYSLDDPAIGELVEAARSAVGKDELTDRLLAVQAALADKLPVLPLATRATPLFMSSKITGAPASDVHLFTAWANAVGAA